MIKLQNDLSFEEEGHLYGWKGRPVESVTQIMARVGVRDGEDNQHWRSISGGEFVVGIEGGIFGKEVHRAIEYHENDVPCEYDPRLRPWINGYKKFIQEHPEYHVWSIPGHGYCAIELQLYSPSLGLAMTCDKVVVTPDQKIGVIDWKTSTAFQKHWRLQLAAYAKIIQEYFKSRVIPFTISVKLEENNYKLDIRRPSEVKIDFNKYQSILNTYRLAA